MGKLEEMLVGNGLICRQPDGSSSHIEGSLISNSLVVRNSAGWVTHRIERSWCGFSSAQYVDRIRRNANIWRNIIMYGIIYIGILLIDVICYPVDIEKNINKNN